ncbi:MAG TPA: methyl-accepting chemotaxis protein [Desulfobacteraceae bacterium]|nr:methyl-accepting chemotaxis protein [Desulfobacteraceae bacterium]
MTLKLRERLLLPILVLIITGMGISIVVSNRYAKESISDITKQQMEQTAANLTSALDAWLVQHDSIIETMSEIGILGQTCRLGFAGKIKRPEANKKLAKFHQRHQGFESIFVSNLEGNVAASSNPEMIDAVNVSDTTYFQKAIEEEPFTSRVFKSRQSGNTVFTVNYPLYDGKLVIGVISGVVRLADFNQIVKGVRIGKSGYVYLCDEKGLTLFHPVEGMSMKTNIAQYEWGKQILEQKKGYLEYRWQGEKSIAVFQQSKTNKWLVTIKALPEELFASIGTLQTLNFTIALVTIIVLGISIVLLTRVVILKPVRLVLEFAKQMASGDLNAKMELDRKDELGELVHSLNGMGDSLNKMFQISALRKLVENLSANAANLKEISLDMGNEIRDVSGKTDNVSGESTEMTASINETATSLEESAEKIATVASGAEEMSSTISEISENTEKTSSITKDAVKTAAGAAERITMFGDAAKEIGEVTSTIKAISEQTNLLALNATIEAARAGEAGKGFAVVASEIKALASQTAQATSEISEKIGNIQSSTDETVTDISTIGSTINEIDTFVTSIAAAIEEQSVTTREISESVNQASSGIATVNASMGENARSIARMTEEIAEISNSTGRLNTSSTRVSEESEDLDSLASEVSKIVDQFKI